MPIVPLIMTISKTTGAIYKITATVIATIILINEARRYGRKVSRTK